MSRQREHLRRLPPPAQDDAVDGGAPHAARGGGKTLAVMRCRSYSASKLNNLWIGNTVSERWGLIAGFWRKVAALVAALSAIGGHPYSGAAEDIARTVRFDATNYTTQGELVGCGFVFSQVALDNTYERGRPIVLQGSIGTIYAKASPLNIAFKLRGESIDPVTMRAKPFQIHYAYLRADGSHLLSANRQYSDVKAAAFARPTLKVQKALL